MDEVKDASYIAGMRRPFYLVIGGLLTLSVLAGVLVALGGSQKASEKLSNVFGPPNVTEDTDSAFADAALVRAANASGFHSTVDSSVGIIENLPAESARPPANPLLLPVGAQAPDFALQTPTGQRVGLRDFKGKVVLLEFFTTLSPACQAEAENIVAMRAALPARLVFLSVNAGEEDAGSVYAFDRAFAIPYPTLLDPGRAVTKSYSVQAYPTFYIIDRNGFVAWRSDGEQPNALLEKKLKETLAR